MRLIDPGTKVEATPILSARLLTWLITTNRDRISTGEAYRTVEEHGIADPFSTLLDLEERGLLRRMVEAAEDPLLSSSLTFEVPTGIRGATGINVKADLWLRALAEIAARSTQNGAL